jgi:hypothetical protein
VNEPFWLQPEQARALTDRQASDWYMRQVVQDLDACEEKPPIPETMEEKKAKYLALCREFGHSEKVALAEWEKQKAELGM